MLAYAQKAARPTSSIAFFKGGDGVACSWPAAPQHRSLSTKEITMTATKEMLQITLEQATGEYAVSRLPAEAPIPPWADGPGFVTISRSPFELSVVCLASRVPAGMTTEAGWTCLRFVGPFAFGATGIILSVVRPLSEGGLGVFVVSTFDGDHILIKSSDLADALRLLGQAGHILRPAALPMPAAS
jgi:hypothetical protein